MKRLLIGLMVLSLAASALGQHYWLKSGATSAKLVVDMYKITDGTDAPEVTEDAIDVTYWEAGVEADKTTYTDTVDVALNAAYTSKGIKWIGGGAYRFDPPVAALDGGIGTDVIFVLDDGTYRGKVIVHLGVPVNAYLSDGSTPPTLNVSSGVVEADLINIHGSALTETAGQLAAAFVKFFDVATPTGTVDSIPDAVAGASGGLLVSTSKELWAGPNFANASTELDGAVADTSLSTTLTIYLTATSAANDAQYEVGRQIAFADTNGVYHIGTIGGYDETLDVIYLDKAVPVAPANLTPIYSLGKVGSSSSVAPPAGGTQQVTGTTDTGCSKNFLYLVSAGLSAASDTYDGWRISITYASPGAGVTNPSESVIDHYNGDMPGSNSDYTAILIPSLPQAPAVSDVFVIYKPDPAGTGTDFGPNAGNAVAEKAGSTPGSTLSTTQTIYLTANTLDSSMYAAGMTVLFADSSVPPVYHYGIISSNSGDTLTLLAAASGTPADGTKIYSLGSMISSSVWDSIVGGSSHNTLGTVGAKIGYVLGITGPYYESATDDSTATMIYLPSVDKTSEDRNFTSGTIVGFYDSDGDYHRSVVRRYSNDGTLITLRMYSSDGGICANEGKVYIIGNVFNDFMRTVIGMYSGR